MFVAGNLLSALATMLDMLLSLYMWIIIIRALISWVNPDPYNPLVQFLYKATEPVLGRVRSWLPMGRIGIDLSPLIVLFTIIFVQKALVSTLHEVAMRMH
ncbi:MAG: YggT family protein [Nitrospirae bacterium]|nr:YggT family protein [Nitrospirota bacterium]